MFSFHPVRCKILVDNTLLQQIEKTEYLGCEISHENEMITKTSKMFSSTGNSKQQFETNFGAGMFKN